MAFHPDDSRDPSLNRERKLSRVRAGRAHAALVFDGDDCVGWCQFGAPDECRLACVACRRSSEGGGGQIAFHVVGEAGAALPVSRPSASPLSLVVVAPSLVEVISSAASYEQVRVPEERVSVWRRPIESYAQETFRSGSSGRRTGSRRSPADRSCHMRRSRRCRRAWKPASARRRERLASELVENVVELLTRPGHELVRDPYLLEAGLLCRRFA